MKIPPKQHILISRVDAIGDVVLTLPMCGYLKTVYPDCTISFLGRTYTGPVINACTSVDTFINYDELNKLPLQDQISDLQDRKIDVVIHVYPQQHVGLLAKRAGIKMRIGTTNRLHHWGYCNKLVKLSRKNSALHEAQLNIVLLKPLGIDKIPSLAELPNYYTFKPKTVLPIWAAQLLVKQKFNLIIHPKSNGSGSEWPLDRFAGLISMLPPSHFNIFITGSEKEKGILQDWIATLPNNVTDLTGKLNLDELIAFIAQADGLLASGTGPLHIAAACGIKALGLYPSKKPIHAGRWGPLGKQATYMESHADNIDPITALAVADQIKNWHREK